MQKRYTDRKYDDIKLFEDEDEYEEHTIDDIIERLLEIKNSIPADYFHYADINHRNEVNLETFRLATQEELVKILEDEEASRNFANDIHKKWELGEYYRIREKYNLGE